MNTLRATAADFWKSSRQNKIIALGTGLVVLVAGTYLVLTQAAGFFAAVEPDTATLTANAKLVNDATASGGKAIQFTAPAPSPTPTPTPTPPAPTPPPPSSGSTTCPLPKYPTAACAGVPAGVTLTNYTGSLTISTPGAIIDGKRINGTLQIRANDVIIKNSEIIGPILNREGTTSYRFTIQDSTVLGTASTGCSSHSSGAIGVANYTARRVKISRFPDGFRIAGSNVTIEDSFVTLCSANPEDHSDGIQAYDAKDSTGITIRHNTIDQRAVTNGAATAPIFVPNDNADQGNQNITISIMDNLVAGGGYGLRLFGSLPFSAPAVTGNKVVNNTWEYGPVDVTCGPIGTWSGNATVTYNWTTGEIISQVQALNNC